MATFNQCFTESPPDVRPTHSECTSKTRDRGSNLCGSPVARQSFDGSGPAYWVTQVPPILRLKLMKGA